MNSREYNRIAWDQAVKRGNRWTIPVSPDTIAAARRGDWQIVLTPKKPIPRDWFPPLVGLDVLCLASGGGQQGPVLSAAGAKVTVLDNCPAQLQQDRLVAERESLTIHTVEGDMAALRMFDDAAFDLIVHPVSNNFVPDVIPVWKEAFRVLRWGGALLSGFMNPLVYLFEFGMLENGGTTPFNYKRPLVIKNRIPYSDEISLSEEEKRLRVDNGIPLEFSHTLEELIGGQMAAGFVITGFYEDGSESCPDDPVSDYIPICMATRAVKKGTQYQFPNYNS